LFTPLLQRYREAASPGKSDASGAAVLNENFGERTQRFSGAPNRAATPRQGKPGDRRYASLHHAPNCHVVRLDGNPTRSIRYGIHIIPSPCACIAGIARHISVQSEAMTSFLRPVFFTASTTRLSSHVLMKVRIDRLLIGETRLGRLDQ